MNPTGDDLVLLWCLVDGNPAPINVVVSPRNYADDLKKAIANVERLTLPTSCIVLWKLDRSIPLKPEDTLWMRIRSKGEISDIATKVQASDKLSDVFRQQPADVHLHIIVTVDQTPVTRDVSFNRDLGTRPNFNVRWSEREELVNALYDTLIDKHLIQVRGPPGCGKTVLLHLLHRRIRQDHPQAYIRRFDSWPKQTDVLTLDDRLQTLDPKYPRDEISFLLLDDAQDTYEDTSLWSDFLKEVYGQGSTYRVALFCSYGGHFSTASQRRGIPFILERSARFSLRQDSGSSHAILLSFEEFSEVVRRFDPVCQKLDQGIRDSIYLWTAGHVGAVSGLLHLFCEKKTMLRNREELLTGEDFDREFPVHEILGRFSSEGIVARGLPGAEDYVPDVTNLFRQLLMTGYVTRSDSNSNSIQACHRRGWLYEEQDQEGLYYVFASPLHASCIAFRLNPTNERPNFPSVFDLSVAVIKRFEPSRLSVPIHRIGPPGQVPPPPEAQWEDEFYRATFAVTGGTVRISPEFASARGAKVAGRIDFLVPSVKWGVEITRDGNLLLEHESRFRHGGAYHAWLQSCDMVEYILLDFRWKSIPRKVHPNVKNLYHVVFDERYETVTIYDSCVGVARGPFSLLED